MELSVSGTRSKTLFGHSICNICAHSNLNRTALKLYVGDLEPITGVVRRNFHILFEYPGALPRLRLLKPASFRLRRLSGNRGSYQARKRGNRFELLEILSVVGRQFRKCDRE